MIELTAITSIEFEKYKNIFIKEEAIEATDVFKYPSEDINNKAINEFDKYFPNEEIQKNEYLKCIKFYQKNNDKTLGYLWYSISDDHLFILDFYIHKEFRGQGYGTQTLEKLQDIALSNNIHQMRLRVAHNNTRAFKLYQELGFSVTGLNMIQWF